MSTAALPFKPATREHRSVLAASEKRVLIWMAHRLPAWVNSDHLTALGLFAMLMAGLSYWSARRSPAGLLWVIFWLAVNWFGDSLDGTLARVRDRQRPRYGFYVDHVVDAFSMVFLFGGLALSGYMSWTAAGAFLIVYFMLCIEVYLATYTVGKFHLAFLGFGPTELRILLAAGNVNAIFHPVVRLFGRELLFFDVGAWIATAGLGAVMMASAWKHTIQLYREETLP